MNTPPTAPAPPPAQTPAPPPPTPPAAAPATATPPPTSPPAAEVDPLVEQIAKSFNKVIEPDKKKEETPVAPPSAETLGDRMARVAKEPPKPAPPPAVAAAPTPPPVPEPPPTQKTVVKTKPPPVQPPAPPPSVPTPPPAPAPAPAPTAEQEQIARLTPAQREEYDMALYAEAHNPEIKGRAAATLAYFKQVDNFAIEHPDSPPDSEEFREFLDKHQPKWQPGERRKIERQMIEENAMAKAKEALRPDLDRLRQEQHLMRVQPLIETEAAKFIATIAEDPKAEQLNPISREVAAKISKEGYDKAVAEYPVEAPIIAQHVGIAREYLNLAHRAVTYDPQSQTHRWINDFVYNQGMILAAQPVEAKTRDGKVFLPLHEFAALRKANPAEASRYWTMDDKMILQMLGHNATKAVAAEIARLEGAGFKREKKLGNPTTPPAKPAEAPPPSPQAQISATPGAASPSANRNESAAFLDALVPGSASRILGS